MNNLVEYYRRHKAEYILPINDGVCFFNRNGIPALVIQTNTPPKCMYSCRKCLGCGDIVLEIFEPNQESLYNLYKHEHIHPDTNILSILPKDLTPVYIKNGEELELWIWDFFIKHNRIGKSDAWRNFVSKQKTTDKLQIKEQMAWCAIKYNSIFNYYYMMYQVFLVGKKYILIG